MKNKNKCKYSDINSNEEHICIIMECVCNGTLNEQKTCTIAKVELENQELKYQLTATGIIEQYERRKSAESKLKQIESLVSGDYITLDPLAKQKIQQIIGDFKMFKESELGETQYCKNCLELSNKVEKLEQELQAQRNFTSQEQNKIYCAAYDKTCETGNECKHENCVFKDRLKYMYALSRIEEIANKSRNFSLVGDAPLLPVIKEVGKDMQQILAYAHQIRKPNTVSSAPQDSWKSYVSSPNGFWGRTCAKLKQRNDELQAKLDKYEEYGGAIDEGRAWVKEAMDKRVLLKDIKDFCNDQNLKYDTTACTILEMIDKALGEGLDED